MTNEEQQAWIENELAESRKFVAEQRKLMAEAQKFEREHWWLPITVLAGNTVVAALVGALVGHFVK